MAINRRKLHNSAIRDAFFQSTNGTAMVVEAKAEIRNTGERIRHLKELVHSVFVANVPRGFSRRFDVYQKSKARVRELGIMGGLAYDEAMLKVKFAWTSRHAYRDAIEVVAG